MQTLRIFISSPGDVQHERLIAKRVINKLAKEYASIAKIEPLLWEDMPLSPSMDFQTGIDTIINSVHVDIAVFILWSRLGSPLNKQFKRKDGTVYASGTEYEYDLMLSAYEQTGTPDILAYVKTASTKGLIESLSEGDLDDFLIQRKAAEKFVKERFFDKETNTVYGAYFKFEKQTSFETQLTTHLRSLINKKVGERGLEIEWQGNPYVGLRAFSYDESEIFYGRSRVVNNIMDRLIQAMPNGAPTLFVLGKSGCGKSSLVRAGLFPDICDYGLIPNSTWKRYDIHPNEYGGAFYKGLGDILFELFPDLKQDPCGEDLVNGLPEEYDARHFIHRIQQLPLCSKEGENIVPLIFIDQFEELFTNPLISEDERKRIIHLLRIIAESKRIWLIFSMRNDFYYEFATYPNLYALKELAFTYDVPSLYSSEYQEIIEEPAKKAGVTWETNEKGESLSRLIANEISATYSDLPLIEFALSQLYDKRNEENSITFHAYNEIGHLKGAIVHYADAFYNQLSEEEKSNFYRILGRLITTTGQSQQIYTKKSVRLEELPSDELRTLSQKLVNSHLFTADKDAEGKPTITIAHEILLSAWPIISDWIKEHRNFIQLNDYYETQSKHWNDTGRSRYNLITHEIDVNEGEFFLHKWGDFTSQLVRDYLSNSIKTRKRKGHYLLSLLDIGSIAFIFICVIAYLFDDASTQNAYWGESVVAVIGICALIGAICASFWQRVRGMSTPKRAKVVFLLWGGSIAVFILDSLLTFLVKGPNYSGDDAWLVYTFYICTCIPFAFSLLNYLVVRKWDTGDFNTVKQDNLRYSKIKSSLRYIVSTAAIIVGIVVILVLYELIDINDRQEKMDKALKVSTTALTALETMASESGNDQLNWIILKYETEAWDELSQIFSEDTVTLYDYRYANLENQLGYPENAIERLEGKKRTDYEDQYLYAKINFKLDRYEQMANYLTQYTITPNDSISNLWQVAKWAIISRHPRAQELLDSASIRYPEAVEEHASHYSLLQLLIQRNNGFISTDEFATSVYRLYQQAGEDETDYRDLVADYLWNDTTTTYSTRDLALLMGEEYDRLYTTPGDSIVMLALSDTLLAHQWYATMDETLFSTEFIRGTHAFRRRTCTLDSDGELSTERANICNYRLKETEKGLILEQYSYDTHHRLAFLVQLEDNGEIIMHHLLPKRNKGYIWVFSNGDDILPNIN